MEFINGCLRDTFARYNRGTKAFSRAIKAIEDSMVIFVNRHLWDRNIRKYANLGRIGYEEGIKLIINNGRCNIEVINQNIRITLENIKKDIIEIRKDIKDIKDGISGLVKEIKDKYRSRNKNEKGGKKVA